MKTHLGIIAHQGHGAAAAFVKDGKLIGASMEERYSRIKDDSNFPVNAVKALMSDLKIKPNEIETVNYAWNPWLSAYGQVSHIIRGFPFNSKYIFSKRNNGKMSRLEKFLQMLRAKNEIKNLGINAPLKYHRHHDCHSWGAFSQSGFSSALSIVVDGSGEYETVTVYEVGKHFQKKIHTVNYPHSLGIFYAGITQLLGFRPDSDEYKVMGLASYGRPIFYDRLKILVSSKTALKLSLQFFQHHQVANNIIRSSFLENFNDVDLNDFQVKADIASSAQKILEESLIEFLQIWMRKYESKIDGICFSGGVFQNCVLNQKIREKFKGMKLFFCPLSSDPGTAVGAAFLPSVSSNNITSFDHLYWGPGYDESEIEKALRDSKQSWSKIDNPASVGAKLLSEGKIIGWYQGRAEMGPRALGNRSILGDPSIEWMKDEINKRIKQRESFRPFAPSVLSEQANKYFDIDDENLTYMIETVRVKKDFVNTFPGIVHVDGTARVQSVKKELNPLYHELISEFSKIKGIGLVLNTSFNVAEEPIVETPVDAIRCTLNSGLDALIIGSYLMVPGE